MFDFARSGDLVVVVALDRLGRSLSGVIRTLEELAAAGVLLRSLREGIDYSTPAGKMLAGIFAARAAVPTDTQLANAAGVALNQLTANPDTVAGPGPGDQRDAGTQPDRNGVRIRQPAPNLNGRVLTGIGAERDQPSPSAVAIACAGVPLAAHACQPRW